MAIQPGRCVLLLASPVFFSEEIGPDDFVIACDGGFAHASKNGVRPQLVVGDFDSYFAPIPPEIEIVRAPTEKDDTDAMLAIRLALARGYRDFLLLGATGGRLDHQIANLEAAAYIAKRGGRCVLRDESCLLTTLTAGTLLLNDLPGRVVSVFSHLDAATGVTLSGMHYPLTDATLTNVFPLGISNVVESTRARVSVKSGILFVIVIAGGQKLPSSSACFQVGGV